MAIFERPVGDGAEHLAGPPLVLLALGDVVRERRAGQEERPAAVEALDVEGRHLSARPAEEDHHAARPQRRERGVEGRPADPVVGDVDAAPGSLAHGGGQVVDRRVVDEVLGAERPCDLELLVGSGRRDDDAAAGRDHLHEELPDPAGRGVHEGDVTRAHGIRARDEVVRGEALEHGGGGDLEVDAVGHGHDEAGGLVDERGLAAGRLAPRDPVTDGHVGRRPAPTAVTVPAPSSPRTNGVGTG